MESFKRFQYTSRYLSYVLYFVLTYYTCRAGFGYIGKVGSTWRLTITIVLKAKIGHSSMTFFLTTVIQAFQECSQYKWQFLPSSFRRFVSKSNSLFYLGLDWSWHFHYNQNEYIFCIQCSSDSYNMVEMSKTFQKTTLSHSLCWNYPFILSMPFLVSNVKHCS